ncbi:hypothetical protein FAF44_05490 [Nonomuraea sp. MG754425]|uniref:hypothetical protein n=1 Tax=Nonomuraea sp. MG754425 TaxID=2570319 RepID=UPI001F2B1B2D|nr:hypothetical protein [Nonomuraea sp. MG754425]MCF6467863.1 hypothetical protein [Nonomuraea sp. MG754425]
MFHEVQVSEVALPSSLRDYTFKFSATVRWRRLRNSAHANPAALAIENITQRARTIVSAEMPETVSVLSQQLNVTLGVPRPDRSGEVEAMASEVSLRLPSEDVQRLEKMAEIRKQEALWAEQRRYEKNRREYLGEDVLKSPGSAVVWWLATKEEGVDQAAALIDTLARLSAAANDDESIRGEFIRKANGGGHVDTDLTAADCLENLMARMNLAADSDEGITFVDRVANYMEKADRSEHAEEIRRKFGIHTPWEELEGVDEESMQEENDPDSQ